MTTALRSFDVDVECRGVLLFPGWFVRDERDQKPQWVLSPAEFLKWFRNEDECVSVDDFNRVKKLLHDYIVNRECAVDGE